MSEKNNEGKMTTEQMKNFFRAVANLPEKDWKKCRCDNPNHWCFVHSKWGKSLPAPSVNDLPNLSKSTENLSKIGDKDKWLDEVRGREASEAADEYAKQIVVDDTKSIHVSLKHVKEDVIDAFIAGTQWGKEADQDELWREVGNIVMEGYDSSNEESVTAKLKSMFSITKK